MATATNPTPTQAPHSLRNTNTDSGAAAISSPGRSSVARGGSSPWTRIVRGGESESTIAAAAASPPPPLSLSPSAPEQAVNASSDRLLSSEDCVVEAQFDNSDNGAAKKPAWNKPSSNGTIVEVSPVMGAVSWPALSESTSKASPKSSSSDSLKALSDAPLSLSQGTGMALSSSQKQVSTNNVNAANSMANHVGPTRQRPMKRAGGGGNPSNHASANGGFPQLQPLQGSMVDLPPNSSGKSGESNSRDNNQRGGFGSQALGGNEHQQQSPRNSYRRGSGGPHPRGDGSYHHGYGSRRGDHERGNQDWNPHRSFGNRDTHMQHQRVPARPFIRPPPHASPHFIPSPLPMRPFATPMVYSDVPPPVIYVPGPHPDPLRMPMIAPVQPVFFPVPDPQLHSKIVGQIDYYFSNENLIKDTFLRQNMDEQGWVSINLIAGFKKVLQLTDNIQLILDAVRSSTVVELQGEKIRRRNDWMKWIMPQSVHYSMISSPQPQQKPSPDSLAEHFQSFAFDAKTEHGNAIPYLSRSSSSAELSSSSKQSDNEIAEQAGVQRRQPVAFGNPSK